MQEQRQPTNCSQPSAIFLKWSVVFEIGLTEHFYVIVILQEEEEHEEGHESDSDDEETVLYNPKNLPLGWDGKVMSLSLSFYDDARF